MLTPIFLKFVSDKLEERLAELIEEVKEDYVDIVEFYTMKNVSGELLESNAKPLTH